ncbi:SpoIIE family protein phosphatase [Streptomyces polyrhachis]|uniref:SpoIIE family protein phosphatase n=1 Tax=Streptomyces polyrhachis TaxID=1282885 RepID=A0ABW2G9M7_9ACTN
MHPEEVLPAVDTGVWSWSTADGAVTLDAVAAELLGLPSPDPATAGIRTAPADLRARIHGLDYVGLTGAADLARIEGTFAEATVRVVDPDGAVLRRLRVRLRFGDPQARTASGTVQEVTEPALGDVPRERQLSREAFLLDAGRALAEAPSTDAVLRTAAALALPGLTPAGQAVLVQEDDHLRIISRHGSWAQRTDFPPLPLATVAPSCEVARTGKPVYLVSREEFRRRFPAVWDPAERAGMNSWAYLPLTTRDGVRDVWVLAFREETAFAPEERTVLATVARMLSQALDRAQAHDSERESADELQSSMMPGDLPAVEGLALVARYVPTGTGLSIGGDWYDVIELPTGKIAVVIGDVQGHDVRAARVMSQLRIAIRAYASEGHDPEVVLRRASRFLHRLGEGEADERFATCLYLEIDPATGAMAVARAGHLDPVLTLADGTMLIHPTEGGLPLGIEEDPDYPVTPHVLAAGETMMLCTDGLAENGGHDLYTGQERLQRAFHDTVGKPLEAVADALVDVVAGPGADRYPGPHSHHSDDDIALVLLRADRARAQGEDGGRDSARRLKLVVPQDERERIADTRGKLRGMLHDWQHPDSRDAAVLALSELLANVMLHTGGPAEVRADLTGPPGHRLLRLAVADTGAALPHRRHPGELASSGRGVLLLDELAGSWGVEPRGEGKAVWCEFREDA